MKKNMKAVEAMPSPVDRLHSDLDFAADQLLRTLPDFKKRKQALLRELEKTAKRAMRGNRKTKEQSAFERRLG